MKAMISQPMAGKSKCEIALEREKAIECLRNMGYEIENTFFEEFENDNVKNKPLWYLAKSISAMSKCEAVYFCNDWEKYRGCRMEHEAAKEYGLDILYSNTR